MRKHHKNLHRVKAEIKGENQPENTEVLGPSPTSGPSPSFSEDLKPRRSLRKTSASIKARCLDSSAEMSPEDSEGDLIEN